MSQEMIAEVESALAALAVTRIGGATTTIEKSAAGDETTAALDTARALLDRLTADIAASAQRVGELYGWHFPELRFAAKTNDLLCVHAMLIVGRRDVLVEEGDVSAAVDQIEDLCLGMECAGEIAGSAADAGAVRQRMMNVVQAVEVSMGADITAEDWAIIEERARRVVAMDHHRNALRHRIDGAC